MSTDTPEAGRHDPVYDEIHDSAEFHDLRRRYQRFIFPATAAFISWYLLFVVMSNWAEEFMSHKLVGNINVALVFGLLQFASTFLIAILYARYANRAIDPAARELEQLFERDRRGGAR